jgi:hypothetical protein
LVAAVLIATAGCEASGAAGRSAESELEAPRVALGASFVGGHPTGLRNFLHSDLIVQPPKPDSALRAAAAVDYLERLARETRVRHSELRPARISREGQFLLEQGTWALESTRWYRSSYTLRWRKTPDGWRVVLWRWTSFR